MPTEPTWEDTVAVEPSWEDTTEAYPSGSKAVPDEEGGFLSRIADEIYRLPQTLRETASKEAGVQQEKMAALGKTFNAAGKGLWDLGQAQIYLNLGEPDLAMRQLGLESSEPDTGEKPSEAGMRSLPTALRIPAEASKGIVETVPRLGAMALMSRAGIPTWLSAAGAFGPTEQGFSPKEAAIAAALPFVGKHSGKIVESMAKQLGITTDAALEWFNKLGGAGGAAGLLGTINEAEILQLPPEQRKEARIQALGGILAQSVLGMTGGREKVEPEQFPKGDILKTPEGAQPPEAGTIFLPKRERPTPPAPELPPMTLEQEIVDAQRMAAHGTPAERELALNRLKVLRGVVPPVERQGKLEEGEPFPRSGVFDTAEEKIIQQKGFPGEEPTKPLPEPIPEPPAVPPVERAPVFEEVPPKSAADLINSIDFYHGTKSEFETPTISKAGSRLDIKRGVGMWGKGIYITSDKGWANDFANMYQGEGTPRVVSVKTQVKNPLIVDMGHPETWGPDQKYVTEHGGPGHDPSGLSDWAKSKGYDAIALKTNMGFDEVVVLEDKAIKPPPLAQGKAAETPPPTTPTVSEAAKQVSAIPEPAAASAIREAKPIEEVSQEAPSKETKLPKFFGRFEAGETLPSGERVIGNFSRKKDAEATGGTVEGYLNGKYKRGWIAKEPIQTTAQPPPLAPSEAKAARNEVIGLSAGIAPPTGPTQKTPVPPIIQRPIHANLEDIYKIFEPSKKARTPLKRHGVNIIEGARTGFASQFRPNNKLAEDIAKSYGGTPKDIAGILEQLKGSTGKGEAEIYRFDRDVSKLVKGDEKHFNAYMFLNRSLDRLRQDEADIAAAATKGNILLPRRKVAGYTIPELESKLRTLETELGPEKLNRLEQASQGYQQYLNKALRLQVESGRMSEELYNATKASNQFYAPFMVMKYLEEGIRPEGTGKKIDTVADYTKAMKGIQDPNFKLGDMLGAARQSILLSRILADKAFAVQHVANLANIDTQGLFIKRLAAAQDPPEGWAAFNAFEKGKKVRYATRPEVVRSLQLFGGDNGGIISALLRGMSVPFKLGATALNVPFQVSNLLADIPRQALVSKYGIRSVTDAVRYPLDYVHALYAAMSGNILHRPNKLYLDFLDSGAAGVTVQEYLTPEVFKYREPTGLTRAKRSALNILYSPMEFSAAIEQTSKLVGIKRAMRFEGATSGADLARHIPEAVTEVRRFSGSPDFGRQGSIVENARLNLLYMFLNARIQGATSDIGRLIGREGVGRAGVTWFRLLTAIGIPSTLLYYFNNRPEYKDDFAKRSQQEKDNYWLIPKDSYITNENGETMRDYWRIPKRESAKWIANLTESALKFAEQRDPKTFYNLGEKLMEDISPVNIQGDTAQERLESIGASLNPVIKAPLEMATGRDMYRHRPLVPETMRKASPEEQYTDRTSEAFKKLAKAMPDVAPEVLRSPLMLENLTRNLTAGLLTQFLSGKPVQGRKGMENFPLLQRFQAIPYTDNKAFVQEMQKLERESADEYLSRHRLADKIMQENPGSPLPALIQKTDKDPKVIQMVVDLWLAKRNGATPQDLRLIALPAKQRGEYLMKQFATMTAEEKQKAITDYARKRVLTRSVFEAMAEPND